MVSREEEPPHTLHHGAREISIGKNKEYKKEIIFYMDVLKTIHKKISNQKMKSRERDKSILEERVQGREIEEQGEERVKGRKIEEQAEERSNNYHPIN